MFQNMIRCALEHSEIKTAEKTVFNNGGTKVLPCITFSKVHEPVKMTNNQIKMRG